MIDKQTGMMIAGGLFGAYTSDITENPLTGLISTGIGIGMGAFMNVSSFDLKENSKVNVGPSIDMDYIQRSQVQQSITGSDLVGKYEGFFKKTETPLELRLNSLEASHTAKIRTNSSNVLSRQVKALGEAESAFEKRLKDINKKYDSIIKKNKSRSTPEYLSLKDQERQEAIERLRSTYDQKINSINSWIESSATSVAERNNKINSKYQNKVNSVVSRYNKEEATYNELRGLLKKNGVSVGDSRQSVLDALSRVTDEGLLRNIDIALKNKNVSFTDSSKLNVQRWESKTGIFEQKNVKGLTDWFVKNMGHNVIDAEEKAKMFLAKSGTDGVVVKDGTISFTDKVDGNRVSVPLTSYTEDGMRYHNMGKGNYSIAKQFNPYASAYLDGLDVNIDGVKRAVTAQDVVKGMDAENLIKFLPEGVSVSTIVPKINRLFHYNSQDAGVISSDLTSDMFKNSQGLVDIGTTIKYDQYGEIDQKYPIRSLKMTGSKDSASEINRTMLKLAAELDSDTASHLTDGISLGNRTSINTQGFSSIATLAPNERGETSVGNRGTRVVNKNSNTQALESLLGTERFNKQFSSSQVLGRVDILDDKAFNAIASALYGNDYVLGDGAGFFNMGDVDSLRIRDKATVKIPLSNNMAIANTDLLLALTSEEGFEQYLKNNPININNDPLAYNQKGEGIHLNRMYTSGSITGGFLVDNEIRLTVDAEFNPEVERNVKLYSTGTKSLNTGVNSAAFDALSAIGVALNSNRLSITANNEYMLDGVLHKSAESVRSVLLQEIDTKKQAGNYIPANLISRAEDTGSEKIIKMIKEGANGNSIYDILMANNHDKQVAGMTAALFSEHKAAVDLTTTLGVNIEQGVADGRYSTSFKQDFLYHFNSDNFLNAKDKTSFLNKAATLVASSDIVSQYLDGHSLAVGSFNKGASIVGKGKQAKMSWAAISNLRQSGITSAELNRFGLEDKGILTELRGISEERRVAQTSVNSIIKGREASFLNVISQNGEAETRLERMKGAFGRNTTNLIDSPFLSYNLTYNDHNIQSLNFSRITTSRSGMYEKDDLKMLKELEGKKLSIMVSDLAYRDSKTKEERNATKLTLTKQLDEYESYVKTMLSGDNNLLKSGLSLYSDKSSIMEVKYIGGEADTFARSQLKDNKQSWFISKEDAKYKAEQLGVNLKYEKVDGYSSLFRPVYERNGETIPLSSLVTREPAQGALSSDLISWYVDTTISENSLHNVYVPVSKEGGRLYYSGMFGDGDQDVVQTLLGDFKSRAEFDAIENKRQPIRSHFLDMVDITESMKVKGKDIGMKTIGDFASQAEYASYRVSGSLKGRNRKSLAAAATGLAVSLSKSLELELGSLGGTSKELTQGRTMIHNLVENLLKSSKLDTDSFQLVNEQAVEKLTRLRSGYLGKTKEGVTLQQYEKELRSTLPEFLGINSIDENSAKGKVTKTNALNVMENIIKAELNHATTVGNTPFTPLDLNEKRFSSSSAEYIDTLNSIIKEQGITDIDYESGVKHLRKSTGQVALGAYDYLLDVAKSNKGVILGGLGAMAGVALLGRDQPSFSDSRAASRQYGANMLQSPGTYDAPSQNNTPMGMETNPNKAGYILPKTFGAKGIKVGGEMMNNANDMYAEYNSLLDTGNAEDHIYNMTNSIFGDGMRSARLQTN